MNERDPDLKNWLDSYQVADSDSELLSHILALASATPQERAGFFAPSFRARAYMANAAAFALVAMLGFWIGAATPTASTATVQSAPTNASYVSEMIFGAHSLKEVIL